MMERKARRTAESIRNLRAKQRWKFSRSTHPVSECADAAVCLPARSHYRRQQPRLLPLNEITWIDWNLGAEQQAWVAFAPDVVRVRKQRPLLRKSAFTTQCARRPRPQVPTSQMMQQRYSLIDCRDIPGRTVRRRVVMLCTRVVRARDSVAAKLLTLDSKGLSAPVHSGPR